MKEHSQRPRTKASSFHRLLLRFDQLRRGFEKCHTLFREIDTDKNGVIDLRELRAGVARRGFHISDALLLSTFDSADMGNNHTIDFKEFILVLAIVSFLAQSGTAEALDADIPHTFQLAEESFLFFDASHDGYIQREELMAALAEPSDAVHHQADASKQQDAGGSSASQDLSRRFEEMDFDHDGTVSFKEFLFALVGWVLEEDAEEPGSSRASLACSEAAAAAAAATAALSRQVGGLKPARRV
ncbi:hypothetical protein WJX81_000741 [Elliptochloris bilobata]|uniref:EF-hand domain-containing protein n=1 Tax=Elliptochloris bilobata TaxID=381761 RepID=A0AAW1QDU5_9CHLO